MKCWPELRAELARMGLGILLVLLGFWAGWRAGYRRGEKASARENAALFLKMDAGRKADMDACNRMLEKQREAFHADLDKITPALCATWKSLGMLAPPRVER